MLQQKLEDASKLARRRRLQAIAAISGAVIFVTLFVSGVITLDFSIFSDTSEAKKAVTVAATKPAAQAPTTGMSEAGIGTINTDPALDQVRKGPENIEGPTQRSELSDPIAVEPTNVDEIRERFKTDLRAFEERISPEIEAPAFKQWDEAGFNNVQLAKDAAISAFSAASYQSALEKMSDATKRGEELIEKRNAEFDAAFLAARESLESDDYEKGSIEIGKALLLKPNAVDAFALKTKVDRLPDILKAVEKAAIARVENNLAAELESLAAVLQLEPDRPGIAERHTEVEQQIKEEKFASYIQRGLDSVDQQNLSGAQTNLKKARAIFSNKSEINLLANRTEVLRKELHAKELISQAIAATKKDDWLTAEKLFNDAGKVLPDNKDATDGAQLAHTINGYRAELTKQLQTSHRLSSSNVSEIVTDLIANAEVYAAFSPKLASQVATLKELQSAYALPVPITVLSDGDTKVTVRGVGVVGVTKVKVIQLKPGSYTFEGARPGFKSKLLRLDVPPGTESLSIKVVCDERI
jgi:hypothetical protein